MCLINRNESLKKVRNFTIKPKIKKNDILVDEIIGVQKIVCNNGIMKTIYKFEKGIVVSCLNINEYYNEKFKNIMFDLYNKMSTKNLKLEGNIVTYEWNDSFFNEKGKDATPYEIKKFLKKTKWKVTVKYKNI